MTITLRIDNQRLTAPLSALSDRLMRYLEDCRNGTATEEDFEYFRDAGITIGVDGYAPHSEVPDLERAMTPLFMAVNTLNMWADEEPIEVKRRWYRLAAEAAMSAIHRARQAQRGDLLSEWPMDEFLHRVWALATAMYERGVTVDEVWFGQEFASVLQALQIRGLKVERSISGVGGDVFGSEYAP